MDQKEGLPVIGDPFWSAAWYEMAVLSTFKRLSGPDSSRFQWK